MSVQDDTHRHERERLERELTAILERWQTPGYLERTPARVLDDERRRHDELGAQLAEAAKADATVTQGGLSSRAAGLWLPLPLYPTAQPNEQPRDSSLPNARGSFESLEVEVFDLLRTPDSKSVASLRSLTNRWSGEPRARRLLAAALRSAGDASAAKTLWPAPRTSHPTPWRSASVNWLNQATELADEFDGLTRTQRAVLRFMQEAAPSARPTVPLSHLTEALRSSEAGVDPTMLEHLLLGLGHPDLKPLPLVELRGLTGRFDPAATHFTHARLSPLAKEVLDQSLALPMLLVNGAEGEGCWIPPHHPHELLSAALALIESPHVSVERLHRLVLGVDLPTHGASEPCRSLWLDGFATLTCTTSVDLDVEGHRCRLVLRRIPWPLRAAQVAARILQHLATGRLDGVIGVRDEPSADEQRVVLELEHLAFAAQVKRSIERSQVGAMQFDVALVVPDLEQTRRRTTLVDVLRSFVEHRKERAVKRLDERVAAALAQARNAEAVCVAVSMAEHVSRVMRTADDDEHAANALTQCFLPEHHQLVARLPFAPSHRYECGFTLEQAKHLLTVTKLATRSLEAASAEWQRRLADVDESRRALSARANVLALVRDELTMTMARFDQPRRSPPWPVDA